MKLLNRFLLRGASRRISAPLLAIGLLAAMPTVAGDYQPLFSPSLLSGLDPATRERFAALEQENYKRWRNNNPQADGAADARRQLQETEQVLQSFAESRMLEAARAQQATKDSARAAKRRRHCSAVAEELSMLRDGGSFYETDDAGVRHFLSESEVVERVGKLEARYKRYCAS